jgi:hypothetical protein
MTNLLINILLLNYYLSNFKKNAYINKNFFILIIILFLPYKTHLSVNILKDIIILLPLVFFFTNRNIYSLFSSFIIATPLRFGAVIYYFLFFDYKNLNKKTIKALFILITIVSIFLFIKVVYNSYDNSGQDLITSIKEFLKARNNAVMGGRSFDAIPSFHEFKSGSLIRAAIWPIFFLTGTFSLFSESYFFYILSLEVLGIQFLIYYFYRKSIISINLILVLMIIGIYCNTFTSYFRYSYIVFYLSTLITFFGAIKNKN